MPRRRTQEPERHEYGSGSVYQRRRDGRWAVAFSRNGKRLPPKYFATEREARRYQQAVLLHGPSNEPSREPLGAYLTRWVQQRVAINNLTPSTDQNYRRAITRFCDDAGLGMTPLGKLRPHHIEAAMHELLKRLSPRTLATSRTILSSALADAARLELIASNPVAQTRAPRVRRSDALHVWTDAQVQQFLRANADDRQIALWTLMLTIGLRDGEARALRWSDLDWQKGTLRIARNLSQASDHEGDTKSHRPRTVELIPELVDELRAHRARQNEERLAAGARWKAKDRIFCLPNGETMTHRATNYRFNVAIKRAGVPRITLHDTRHTAATNMLANLVPIATVAQVLGHSNPSITLRVYAHVLPQDVEAAKVAMRKLLGKDAPAAEKRPENG